MHAGELLGTIDHGRQPVDVEIGRVAGDQGQGSEMRPQRVEQRLLCIIVLEHRLDQQVAAGHCGRIGRNCQARKLCAGVGGGQSAALDQCVENVLDALPGPRSGLRIAFEQHRFNACRQAGLHNSGAHRAAAGHRDASDCGSLRRRRQLPRAPFCLEDIAKCFGGVTLAQPKECLALLCQCLRE